MAVDQQGRAYVTGYSGNFDGQVGLGDTSAFVTCYDAAGVRQWTRFVQAFKGGVGYALAVDGATGVYVAGHTAVNPLYEGPQPRHLTTYVNGVQFLTQFTPDGTERWTRCWGSTNSSTRSLGLAADGALYTAGFTLDGYDGQPGAGENDLCLSRWVPVEPPQFLTLPVVTNAAPLEVVVEPTLVAEATDERQELPIRWLRGVARWAH